VGVGAFVVWYFVCVLGGGIVFEVRVCILVVFGSLGGVGGFLRLVI